MTEKEKIDFVKEATQVRWKIGKIPATLDLNNLLIPNRDEDKPNTLWNVFNVVQEKFVRGGVNYTSNNGRKTGLKGLNNIISVNNINTRLWEIAEQYS